MDRMLHTLPTRVRKDQNLRHAPLRTRDELRLGDSLRAIRMRDRTRSHGLQYVDADRLRARVLHVEIRQAGMGEFSRREEVFGGFVLGDDFVLCGGAVCVCEVVDW